MFSRSRVWILKDLPLLTRTIVKGDGFKIFLQIEITERLKNNVYFDKYGIGIYLLLFQGPYILGDFSH